MSKGGPLLAWMCLTTLALSGAAPVIAGAPVITKAPVTTLATKLVIAPPGATWTPVIAQAQATPPQVQVLGTAANLAKLRFDLPGFHQVALTKERIRFHRLSFPDAGVTTEVGKPEVPLVRQLVAVPEGATATITVKTGAAKTLSNYMVYPVQPPMPEQGRLEMPFEMNRAFYAENVKYPAQNATVSSPMMLGRTRVVLLEVAPMQYNPAQKQLTVYENVDVDVSFSAVAAASATGGGAITSAPSIHTGVINADLLRRIIHFDLPWDYLIITADAFEPDLAPLVAWKQSKGLGVHVARISEVGSTPAQIQTFIRNAYNSHGVRYVLLVGDTNTVPPYIYSSPADTAASDYYYALVSGSDFLPDLAIGRFSARTNAEVQRLVSKSVKYDKGELTASTAWYKQAVLISDAGYFQDTSNWVASFLSARGYGITKLYHTMGNANVTNVANAVNSGKAFVNYRGHGSQTGWSTSGFANSNVNALTNGWMLPVVISPTCLTGCFDYSATDCYGETWDKSHSSTAPRGAVAYWGSSRISYGGYNDELCKGVYKAIFNDGLRAMGDIVNKAKLYMVTAMGLDETAKLELHMFTLFGDPELNVRL